MESLTPQEVAERLTRDSRCSFLFGSEYLAGVLGVVLLRYRAATGRM